MRNTDIINSIFSDALNQLENEWGNKDSKAVFAEQQPAETDSAEVDEYSEASESVTQSNVTVADAADALASYFSTDNADCHTEGSCQTMTEPEADVSAEGQEATEVCDVDSALNAMLDFFPAVSTTDKVEQPKEDSEFGDALGALEGFFDNSKDIASAETSEIIERDSANESAADSAFTAMEDFFLTEALEKVDSTDITTQNAVVEEPMDSALDAVAQFGHDASFAIPLNGGIDANNQVDKENDVAVDKDELSDFLNSDLPPDGADFEEDEEDLDSLLNDLASSADVDDEQEDDDPLSEFDSLTANTQGDAEFDNLLEDALGLGEIGSDSEDITSGYPESSSSEMEHSLDADPGFSEEESSDLDRLLEEASFDSEEKEFSTSDDDDSFGKDFLNDNTGEEDFDEDNDAVMNIPVPDTSIPLSDEADEELERKLAEMGLGGDNLLHNRFSGAKEKLLEHLMQRFELLARRKLEGLPNEHVGMIKSVNLRVEIDLKFGEYITSGNDDSLFSVDF